MQAVNQTLAPGVSFLSLPDSRFKTAQLWAALLLPLREETASANAIVPYLLRRCCAAYPNMTALARRLNELYGARISAQALRLGDQQVLVLAADCIDGRYALDGEPVAADCAELLLSMLFEPALENGVFRAEDLELERRCLIERIEADINEKRWYARQQCERLLCRDEAYAVNVHGTVERVKELTAEQVTDAWKAMLETAPIQWVYQGGDDGEAVAAAIRERFAGRPRRPAVLTTQTRFAPPSQVREETETMAVNQSKLVMGFRVGIAEPDREVAAARLMNALLGGTPHSLLFRNVREKLSLCYYCASSYDRIKGVLLVDSGVEAAKAQEARAEILRQLDRLRQGDFTDEDLESARRSIVNQFLSVDDLQGNRSSWYLGQCHRGGETCPAVFTTPEEAVGQLAQVTREDVRAAAEKVTLLCVYQLKAEEKEAEEA